MLHTLALISHTHTLKMSQTLGCYTHSACYTNTPMQMLHIISQMSPALTQMSQTLNRRVDTLVLLGFVLSYGLFGYVRPRSPKPAWAKRGLSRKMKAVSQHSRARVGFPSPSLFQGRSGSVGSALLFSLSFKFLFLFLLCLACFPWPAFRSPQPLLHVNPTLLSYLLIS